MFCKKLGSISENEFALLGEAGVGNEDLDVIFGTRLQPGVLEVL